MKQTAILIALACTLAACGGDNASSNTHAASRPKASNTANTANQQPGTRETLTDPNVARTPVTPPTPPMTPKPVEPDDIDTRDTDPVGTDATVIRKSEDKDPGMSDALTQPGVPKTTTGNDTTASATKPGSKPTTPGAKALGSMDTEFISKAIVGGLFEVQSSELAVTQSTTPFVREFAQMMVMDHGDANRELEQLARGKGATIPTELDQELQSRLSTLRDQRGVDFDRQYRDMQVTAHKDAIALFDRAAANCEDPELKAYAEKILPSLRDHQKKLNEMPPTQG